MKQRSWTVAAGVAALAAGLLAPAFADDEARKLVAYVLAM
jgi:hypothetical protein